MPRQTPDKAPSKPRPPRASDRPKRARPTPAAKPDPDPHHDTLAGTGMEQEPTR